MKKIMFNDRYSLTQAVLDGRKTMTRRIIPQCILDKVEQYRKDYYEAALESISFEKAILNMVTGEQMFSNYHYQIGEEVAVAQCYEDIWKQMVDGEAHANQCYKFYRERKSSAGWNNKMFVRADIMPHRIRITNIKVEQLQDITDWECLAEGIVRADLQVIGHETLYSTNNTPAEWYAESARTAYATLIDKISGKGTWKRNPFVFAYSFELID